MQTATVPTAASTWNTLTLAKRRWSACFCDETLDRATDLIDGDVRFFGLQSACLDPKGCDLHQRFFKEYGKTHVAAVDA